MYIVFVPSSERYGIIPVCPEYNSVGPARADPAVAATNRRNAIILRLSINTLS
jgi:hypothetical protein